MSSRQKNPFSPKKVKTILKRIKEAPSDDICALFKVSYISKSTFETGIMDFQETEQQELIDAILKNPILDFLSHEKLSKWKEMPDTSKSETLKNVYDILKVISKADKQPELKFMLEKLVEMIEQHKKLEAQREAVLIAEMHKLRNIISDELHIQQKVLDAALEEQQLPVTS